MILQNRLKPKTQAEPPKAADGGITLYSQPGDTQVNWQNSYSIVIPSGVTSVAAVAIGAGGAGGGCSTSAAASAGGGGGGALSYSNAIPVTPGETLTVVVPTQSSEGTTSGSAGAAGAYAALQRGATTLLYAQGGRGGTGRTNTTTAGAGGAGGSAAVGVGTVKFSGGSGGAGSAATDNSSGGGGAAGYAGNGGVGGTTGGAGTSVTGGGGGGGSSYTNSIIGGSGGGTLWYGLGTSGAGGTYNATQSIKDGDLGSSLGGSAAVLITPTADNYASAPNVVGVPGGGGSGAPSGGSASYRGMRGAGGAVRVLWGSNLDFGNAASGVSYNNVFYRGHTTARGGSILIPQVQLGDTLIHISLRIQQSYAADAITPTGFTYRRALIGSNSATYNGITTTWYRTMNISTKQVLSAAESGTSVNSIGSSYIGVDYMIAIAGTSGASYSSRGTPNGINYGGLVNTTNWSTTYNESGMDGYAHGTPVGILFMNNNSDIDPSTAMTYAGATTLAGPSFISGIGSSYIKLKAYPQATTSISEALAITPPSSSGEHTFWVTKFF